MRRAWGWAVLALSGLLGGCAGDGVGNELRRRGDEIVIAGRYFHTGAPVVLWTDPGGYDAYRVERRFGALEASSWEEQGKDAGAKRTPNRFGPRREGLGEELVERTRGGGWDLDSLRGVVDQFVVHYDVCGTSRACFRVLHDVRGLSVHFMLDIDGTIYQTLDAKERAWHATTSNTRSVGVEIANIGAYPPEGAGVLDRWYADEGGRPRIVLPAGAGDGGVRTPGFVGRPARAERISGTIQGRELVQHDLTEEQYESLSRLVATVCTVLPRVRCDYPRDASGELVRAKLGDEELERFAGLIGHFHIQKDKVDPGPAFDWDRVVGRARELMSSGGRPATSGGDTLSQR